MQIRGAKCFQRIATAAETRKGCRATARKS